MLTDSSVLVLDDEEIMREILESLLAKEGYHVRSAASGPVAVEAAREDIFDAAIVDLMMPVGVSCCSRAASLRRDKNARRSWAGTRAPRR